MTTTTFMTTIAAAAGANAANGSRGAATHGVPVPFACGVWGAFLLVLSVIAIVTLLVDYFKHVDKGYYALEARSFIMPAILGVLGTVFVILAFILP